MPMRVWLMVLFAVAMTWWLPTQAATVNLSWNASLQATSYRLYYGIAPGSYQTVLEAGAATTASVSGLTNGIRYYFAATASNQGGESGYSNEVSTVPGALAAVAVNGGGPQFTAGDSTVYEADRWSSGGSTYSTTAAIDGTTDDALYRTERYGNFTYNLPVANGTYLVQPSPRHPYS
jgi:Malectin domain